LKSLIRQGRTGIFYDQQEIFNLLRFGYDKAAGNAYGGEEGHDIGSESEVLLPAQRFDVLVLDDLGSMPLNEWSRERLVTILNERYNNQRITIITTNYRFEHSLLGDSYEEKNTQMSRAQRANTTYTLGDRVTDRVFSRLQQMCVPVDVFGADFRGTVGKARHP
jgi:DNA replication protein DnaC